ncbi:Na+/H+ antiporter subunit E [Tessaracoccus caeni]|uniref:Na+/H+ antiporter subunit E n=1 Tax=Tessaracoccus caeni TaxID=3031239 RepID=UPI0023DC6948|nr:Na+/H+ antiporter subunit E [Tessaracoccus caeni]MDF1487327.1 Na+/H+ antiporter subunit E [Tessaracoccus caeni]
MSEIPTTDSPVLGAEPSRRIKVRRRLRARPMSMIVSGIIWCCLWASLSPAVFLGGAALGWLVTVIFPLPPIFWTGRFSPLNFLVLLGHLLADLAVSSFRVLLMVLPKKIDLRAGIVRVDLHSDNDLYQVQVATLISLVPGTVVVEVVRKKRRLYLHVIGMDPHDPTGVVQAMTTGVERRVMRTFASKTELAEFEAKCLAASRADETADDWEVEQ